MLIVFISHQKTLALANMCRHNFTHMNHLRKAMDECKVLYRGVQEQQLVLQV